MWHYLIQGQLVTHERSEEGCQCQNLANYRKNEQHQNPIQTQRSPPQRQHLQLQTPLPQHLTHPHPLRLPLHNLHQTPNLQPSNH
jgi:hypothetical protein